MEKAYSCPMNGEELKKLVPVWARKVGIRKARLELQLAGLGFSTAMKLINGEYESTPKGESVEMLEKAMAEFISAS